MTSFIDDPQKRCSLTKGDPSKHDRDPQRTSVLGERSSEAKQLVINSGPSDEGARSKHSEEKQERSR